MMNDEIFSLVHYSHDKVLTSVFSIAALSKAPLSKCSGCSLLFFQPPHFSVVSRQKTPLGYMICVQITSHFNEKGKAHILSESS